jgi:DNA-binding MarR family transcriptional regulator
MVQKMIVTNVENGKYRTISSGSLRILIYLTGAVREVCADQKQEGCFFVTQKQIGSALGYSASWANIHLRPLIYIGLVEVRRTGRASVFRVSKNFRITDLC